MFSHNAFFFSLVFTLLLPPLLSCHSPFYCQFLSNNCKLSICLAPSSLFGTISFLCSMITLTVYFSFFCASLSPPLCSAPVSRGPRVDLVREMVWKWQSVKSKKVRGTGSCNLVSFGALDADPVSDPLSSISLHHEIPEWKKTDLKLEMSSASHRTPSAGLPVSSFRI